MVNITLSLDEDLKSRLDKSKIEKSKLFREAAELKLRQLEQENEETIPEDIIKKIMVSFTKPSFNEGKNRCLEWIRNGARYSDVVRISELKGTENVFSALENIGNEMLGDSMGKNPKGIVPFENLLYYENEFSERTEEIFDSEAFADGFVFQAQRVVDAINNLKNIKKQDKDISSEETLNRNYIQR